MLDHAKHLVQTGVRPRTAATYNAAQQRYLKFCFQINAQALPCSEETALLYVAYLSKEGLKASSVRVYLAALRSLHIEQGLNNPLEGYMRIHRAVRAIEIESEAPKQKLPITYAIMEQLESVLKGDYFQSVLWAAMTLAYFGCLRCAEVTHLGYFDASVNLSLADLVYQLAKDNEPDHLSIKIKRSKTDKMNKGFYVHVKCSNTKVCCYCALSKMLCRRRQIGLGSEPNSPLFLFQNGNSLSRAVLIQQTRLALSSLGFDGSLYSGHSFRAGSATTAAMAGTPDWQIKLLGRWSSDAYQLYIRSSVSSMLSITPNLCHK